ncbi:MAG TPA: hypothetical protein ENH62_10600 [Marinobacter sp.]|uniref:DUF4926 domain-containing protein n=1 Tax=marine sediment metagenome TaxID=412755 RepID=A0A0F9MS05_9ZZZZ|nr:hypothetical protein [Marinobacter sp.]
MSIIGREISAVLSNNEPSAVIGRVVSVAKIGPGDWQLLYERSDGTLSTVHHEQVKLLAEKQS